MSKQEAAQRTVHHFSIKAKILTLNVFQKRSGAQNIGGVSDTTTDVFEK